MDLAATVEPWVRRARKGDARAWDALVAHLQTPLFIYCAELLDDRTEALDVVQEAFLRGLQHMASLREPRAFPAWLYRIARQRCLRRLRRQGRWQTDTADTLNDCPADSPDPAEGLIAAEQRAHFGASLAALEPSLREVLVLFFLEELSLREIAALVSVPEGTVKSRLHRAKRALSHQLTAAYATAP